MKNLLEWLDNNIKLIEPSEDNFNYIFTYKEEKHTRIYSFLIKPDALELLKKSLHYVMFDDLLGYPHNIYEELQRLREYDNNDPSLLGIRVHLTKNNESVYPSNTTVTIYKRDMYIANMKHKAIDYKYLLNTSWNDFLKYIKTV